MEYDLAVKRNEWLVCTATWMDLKGIRSERSKSEKVTDGMIPLITFSKIQDDSDGEQSRGCQKLGGENESDQNGHRASFWGDEKF